MKNLRNSEKIIMSLLATLIIYLIYIITYQDESNKNIYVLNLNNLFPPISDVDVRVSDFDNTYTISFKDAKNVDWFVQVFEGNRNIVLEDFAELGNKKQRILWRYSREEAILIPVLASWMANAGRDASVETRQVIAETLNVLRSRHRF